MSHAPRCTVWCNVTKMNRRAVRFVQVGLGILTVLVGALWIGQGFNLIVIPGSGMTGSSFWLWTGVIVGIVGVVLLVVGLRRTPDRR